MTASDAAPSEHPGTADGRTPRAAVLLLVVLAVAFVVMAAVLTPWHPLSGADPRAAPVHDYFSRAQIARSGDFFAAARWPSWLGLLVSLVVAVAVAFTPFGRALVVVVRRRVRWWWVQVIVLVVAVTLVQTIARLPFTAWSHHVARDWGLSTAGWGGWTVDLSKTFAVSVVLTSIAMVILVALARRLPRLWYLPVAGATGALVMVMSFAYPVVVQPIFNNFTPLHHGKLRADLLRLAHEDGIEVSDVLVSDASRRTSALNAYVSGFGATKRIVVYDNLLRSTPRAQIELIVAHELGHAKHRDVLVGTVEGAVASAGAVVGLFLVLRPRLLRRRVRAKSVGDPAIVPVVLGLAVLGSFVAAPVQDTISRHVEARADAHSLHLTHDPGDFVGMQQHLALVNLNHLTPNPVLSFWFGTHPTTLERIGMGVAWQERHGDQSGLPHQHRVKVAPLEPGRSPGDDASSGGG
ncbi:MAG: M48 family metallopeptidase [Nocardioidaceae bacterium]